MFNRSQFNRIQFGRQMPNDHSDSLYAALHTEGCISALLHVRRAIAAGPTAVGHVSARIVRERQMATDLDGQAIALLHISRIRYIGAALDGESLLAGTGLQRRSADILELHGLGLRAGDELSIDTEHMTVFINGNNAVDKLTDLSVFFRLERGSQIDFDGDGFADLSIVWKDRWY